MSPAELARGVPTAREVLADPAASGWLKACLSVALRRDPVDAANDAELLADVLAQRAAVPTFLREQAS